MICSTIFLAAVLNAEDLSAPAPVVDVSEVERRLLGGGHSIIGGENGLPPRWLWDRTFEKPRGTRDHGSHQTWYYTREQQQRLGVDERGESGAVSAFPTNDDFIAPIGGNWEEQMPRWIRYPTFEKPAGTLDLGSSTLAVYTAEQQARLGVDQYGEDMRRRFGQRKSRHAMAGACQCSNGLKGMVTAYGCINCKPMPGQCQCPNGEWSGMLTAEGCVGCQDEPMAALAPLFGQCTCSNGGKGMLTADGCVNCTPMPGQCQCPNGRQGMLVAHGQCVCDEVRVFG